MSGRIGNTDEVLTVQEVADYLKVTTKTVYSLIRNRELRSFRIGRAVRCRSADVDKFIREQEATDGASTIIPRDSGLSEVVGSSRR